MDATANDVPSTFDVRGFPTLYWLPKDSKNKPIRYEVFKDLSLTIQQRLINMYYLLMILGRPRRKRFCQVHSI